MWCVSGLLPGHITYAVLDVYALFIMYTKYTRAPVKDSACLFVSQVSFVQQEEDDCSQEEAAQRHRVMPASRQRTVNEDSEDEDEGGSFLEDGHEDIHDDEGNSELGRDWISWCRNAIDKFVKDTRQENLLLCGVLTADQRKDLHDYADTYRLFHQSEGPRTCRRIRISRSMPRVSITPVQAHEWEGVQVPHQLTNSTS